MEVLILVQANFHESLFLLLPLKYIDTSTNFHHQLNFRQLRSVGSCQELSYSLTDSHILPRVSSTAFTFHESPLTSITSTSIHRRNFIHVIRYESKLLLRWKQNTFHGRLFTSEVSYVKLKAYFHGICVAFMEVNVFSDGVFRFQGSKHLLPWK